ncbi:hypothetical protein [Thermopirellula anaerolimosa]
MLRRVGPWLAVFVVGTVFGLSAAMLRPQTPVHTVATDRASNFAIATGSLDNGVEGFFFLDFLTGQLRGAVLSNQTRSFQALYEANVYGDLLSFIQMKNAEIQAANAQARRSGGTPRPEIQVPQTPNYLIVTGLADIRRGPSVGVRPGQSVIYVAETNTGVVLAYAIPWSPESHSANRPFSSPLQLWAADQFSTVVLRTE